jgi:hypothetical protein
MRCVRPSLRFHKSRLKFQPVPQTVTGGNQKSPALLEASDSVGSSQTKQQKKRLAAEVGGKI